MENKDWLNDYEILKQISTANPFIVPDGYFDDLDSRIVARRNFSEIKDKGITGGFTVPEGYFDQLTSNVSARIALEQIAGDKPSGFVVPEGYFDGLASDITARITLEEIAKSKNTGFSVPEGYFDELASNVQSRIAVEQALNTEENGFTVPGGYFDNLSDQITARILIEESAGEQEFGVPAGYFADLEKNILEKTVNAASRRHGVVRRLFASTAFKYATAACVALAIGGGIVLRELTDASGNAHQNSFLHKELSTVPISEIKSYLQVNLDAGDTQQTISTDGSMVDDNDLKQALQNYADSVQ